MKESQLGITRVFSSKNLGRLKSEVKNKMNNMEMYPALAGTYLERNKKINLNIKLQEQPESLLFNKNVQMVRMVQQIQKQEQNFHS